MTDDPGANRGGEADTPVETSGDTETAAEVDDDGDAAAADGAEESAHGGEWGAVAASEEPVTVDRLLADLRELVAPGADVLVHVSMSALGWVPGGAPAVVDALMGAVTDRGTLTMPTHTPQYGDPTEWEDPPIPDDWIPTVRERTPAYRPELTPTRGMGAVPECFRSYPGVERSAHPLHSFAAWGARREFLVEGHELAGSMGEGSPLGRLYDLAGSVLLVGVGHERSSSLHLAEDRAGVCDTRETGAAVLVEGERRWATFEQPQYDDSDFAALGEAFEAAHPDAVERGRVGQARAILLDQVELVDFAVDWLTEHR